MILGETKEGGREGGKEVEKNKKCKTCIVAL